MRRLVMEHELLNVMQEAEFVQHALQDYYTKG